MFSHAQRWSSAWSAAVRNSEDLEPRESSGRESLVTGQAPALRAHLVAAALDRAPEIGAVVDLDAGDGSTLAELHRLRPDLGLFGIGSRERPMQLAESITWCRDHWHTESNHWERGEAFVVLATLDRPTMLIAFEWLDHLPCTVVSRHEDGMRTVLVRPDGSEEVGGAPSADDQDWAREWWPDGDRIEVGASRDEAWSAACTHLSSFGGLALMIDFGHLRSDRPPNGTLTGHDHGHRIGPTLSGRIRLTAEVAVDSLAASAEAVGAETVELDRLGPATDRLATDPAVTDASDLTALLRRTALHAATTMQTTATPTPDRNPYWLLQHLPPNDPGRPGARSVWKGSPPR